MDSRVFYHNRKPPSERGVRAVREREFGFFATDWKKPSSNMQIRFCKARERKLLKISIKDEVNIENESKKDRSRIINYINPSVDGYRMHEEK